MSTMSRKMHPKKVLAARQEMEMNNSLGESSKREVSPAPKCKEEKSINEAEAVENVNTSKKPAQEKKYMYDPKDDIIAGKRKRNLPVAEQTAHDWLDQHLEEKEDVRILPGDVYTSYLDFCSTSAIPGVDMHFFIKLLKSTFPKGYCVKEGSPYKGIVKERKPVKKKPSIQGETFKLKMRDLIEQAMKDMGNPRKGIRFHNLKVHLNMRYPALRLDVRPLLLKSALLRGVRFGYIQLVRGIGACGFYRLTPKPGEEEKEEEEEEAKKQKKAEKNGEAKEGEEGEKNSDEENKDEAGEEKQDGDGKAAVNGEVEKSETTSVKKGKKRKSTEAASGTKAKKAKTKKKAKAPAKQYRSYIVHSDPQRIEDTFYMAMAYMSEPKKASVGRIRKYVVDHYKDITMEKLKKELQTGEENGWWEQASGGAAGTGSYQLLMDEFNPSDDKQASGMIANAIVSSNEPKECSANLLKKYVQEYHPDFKITEKPFLFKKALFRAEAKGLLKRITGIGCSGTFQLKESFVPSPVILAGEDKEDDYDESEASSSEDEDMEVNQADLSYYQDAYKPRPTKRRGKTRDATVRGVDRLDASFKSHYQKKEKSKKRKASSKKKKYAEESDESSSEEEDDSSDEEILPSKKRGKPTNRGAKSTAEGKPTKKAVKAAAKSKAKKTTKKSKKPKTSKKTSANDDTKAAAQPVNTANSRAARAKARSK